MFDPSSSQLVSKLPFLHRPFCFWYTKISRGVADVVVSLDRSICLVWTAGLIGTESTAMSFILERNCLSSFRFKINLFLPSPSTNSFGYLKSESDSELESSSESSYLSKEGFIQGFMIVQWMFKYDATTNQPEEELKLPADSNVWIR